MTTLEWTLVGVLAVSYGGAVGAVLLLYSSDLLYRRPRK